MSSYADTYSTTYTTADIGKVIDCFAADFDMVAQSTGLRTREDARAVSADVKTMAQNGYLAEVDLVLWIPAARLFAPPSMRFQQMPLSGRRNVLGTICGRALSEVAFR